jgi:ABC-type transport system involved in multi-copper enzyme maturation permease subunit
MWSLLAVMVSFYSVLLGQTGFTRSLNSLQYFLGWLTLGSLAMSAAGSFRRERESGVLELLLVSPLKEWEIIKGRVRGLWAQYAPAMALFVFVWLYVATLTTRGEGVLGPVIYFSATFVLLPIVGLYFSLAKDGFIGALVGTVLIAGIFPFIVPRLLELAVMLLAFLVGMDLSVAWARALLRYEWVNVPLFLTLTVQFALAWRFAHRLHSNLRQRRFKLDRKMN